MVAAYDRFKTAFIVGEGVNGVVGVHGRERWNSRKD